MQKHRNMIKQYAIVTDLSRCLGCHTCAIGCIMENELPPGVAWLSVRTIGGPTMDTPSGKYPRVSMHYFPVQCMPLQETTLHRCLL